MTPLCSASLDKTHDVLASVIWLFPCRGLHNFVSKNAPLWTRPSQRTLRIGVPLPSNRLRVKWSVNSTLRGSQFVVCMEDSWFLRSNVIAPFLQQAYVPLFVLFVCYYFDLRITNAKRTGHLTRTGGPWYTAISIYMDWSVGHRPSHQSHGPEGP